MQLSSEHWQKNWQADLQWKICLIVNRMAKYIFLVVFVSHKVSALAKVQKQITQKNPLKCALERKKVSCENAIP